MTASVKKRARRFGRHRKTALLLLPAALVLCVAVLAVKRKGVAHHLGVWRSGMLLEKSDRASRSGEWESAKRSALAAWQLHPGNVEALRQLFVMAREAGTPDVFHVGITLFLHPEAESRDRTDVIRVFFAAGDLVSVSHLLAGLPDKERTSPDALELGARLLISRNRPFEALPLIDRLRTLRSESRDLLLAADALSLIESQEGLARDEAQRLIHEIFVTADEPELALAAFSLLRRIPREDRQWERFEGAEERLASISREVEVPASTWLLADEIRIALSPERREEIVQFAIDRWLSAEAEDLGNWLLEMNEADRVVSSFPSIPFTADLGLLIVHLRARIAREQWDEAMKILVNDSSNLDPSVDYALRALILSASGQELEAGRHWQQSLHFSEISSRSETYLALGKIASLAGNDRIRNLAAAEALKLHSGPGVPASDVSLVFADLVDRNRHGDLLAISRRLLASQPGNPKLLNNVVWLELLHGTLSQARVSELGGWVERFPTILGLRTTYALSKLHKGEAEYALRLIEPVLEQMAASEEVPPPTDLAVVAYVLLKNGNSHAAASLAAKIRWEKMMPVERDFFRKILDNLPSAP